MSVTLTLVLVSFFRAFSWQRVCTFGTTRVVDENRYMGVVTRDDSVPYSVLYIKIYMYLLGVQRYTKFMVRFGTLVSRFDIFSIQKKCSCLFNLSFIKIINIYFNSKVQFLNLTLTLVRVFYFDSECAPADHLCAALVI